MNNIAEKPGIFNVKTLTHVSFLKLTTLEFNNVLKFYPDFKEDLRLVVEEVKSGLVIKIKLHSTTHPIKLIIKDYNYNLTRIPRTEFFRQSKEFLWRAGRWRTSSWWRKRTSLGSYSRTGS